MKRWLILLTLVFIVFIFNSVAFADETNFLITNSDKTNIIFGNDKVYCDEHQLFKGSICSITFVNHINVPTYAVSSWDASLNKDGRITAWIVKKYNENGKYELYIGSTETIYFPKSSSRLFKGYSNVTNINFNNINTSNVISMYELFSECNSLVNLDLSNFNTSSTTDMSYMFNRCYSLNNLDVSKFDTSNVVNMKYMFCFCKTLTNLNLSNFDTKNVTDMSSMFNSCRLLTSLDISNFDSRNVKSFEAMFCDCKSMSSLNLEHFYTDNATVMTSMFLCCDSLSYLNLSNFDTTHVYNMDDMFEKCYSLKYLSFGFLNTINMGSISIFEGCYSLEELHIKNVYSLTTSSINSIDYSSLSSLNIFTIDEAKLYIAKPVQSKSRIYDGTTQTANISVYSPAKFAVSYSSNTATDAGNYKAIASLKFPDACRWDDKSVDDVEVDWEISKAKLEIPYYNDMIAYTGNVIDFSSYVKNYNSSIISISGNYGISSGRYRAVFSIKNSNNYEWKDGSTNNKVVDWEIVNINNIPESQYGDLNNNLTVDIIDVRVLLQKVIANQTGNWTENEIKIGDLNKDGTIDIIDVRVLLGKVIGDN